MKPISGENASLLEAIEAAAAVLREARTALERVTDVLDGEPKSRPELVLVQCAEEDRWPA